MSVVCRLCLSKFKEKDVYDPKETLKVLQSILPHMSRTVRNAPVFCEICTNIVKTAENFMKIKTETDSRVIKELRRLKVDNINLMGFQENKDLPDSVRVCRICLKLVYRPSIFLYDNGINVLDHDLILKMFSFCDMAVNDGCERPIMCCTCWEHLQITYCFKKEYQEVERKIKVYCQDFRLCQKNVTISTLQLIQNYFSDEYCAVVPSTEQYIKKENYNDPKTKRIKRKTKTAVVKRESTGYVKAKQQGHKEAKVSKNTVKTEIKFLELEEDPKEWKFNLYENISLVTLYYEITDNEQNFPDCHWRRICNKWNELKPHKTVLKEKVQSQIRKIFSKNLVSLEVLEDIKRKLETYKNKDSEQLFSKTDNLILVAIYYEVTDNEQHFPEWYCKRICDKWNELNPHRTASREKVMSQIRKIFSKNFISQEILEDIKRELKTYKSKSNAKVMFSKADYLILVAIYYEVTDNGQNFPELYWERICNKWNELYPHKTVSRENVMSQIRKIFSDKLVSQEVLEVIKKELEAYGSEKVKKNKRKRSNVQRETQVEVHNRPEKGVETQTGERVQNQTEKETQEETENEKHNQTNKDQHETHNDSDSDDTFEEVAISSFTPRIKTEPLSDSDVEVYDADDSKMEIESDNESLPELERMDIPPEHTKIEDLCSLDVKREEFDNFQRNESINLMSPSFFAVEGKKKRKSGPPLNCIECNFQTIHQVSLHCHIMAHQMGTLNIYSCSYCPYRISNKAQFNKHMKTHTEDDEIPILEPSGSFPSY